MEFVIENRLANFGRTGQSVLLLLSLYIFALTGLSENYRKSWSYSLRIIARIVTTMKLPREYWTFSLSIGSRKVPTTKASG